MGVRNRTTAAASTQRFDDALDQTYQGVRGALTEVLISVKADPTKPQDMARRFGINKNLAWKISKIVTVPEPHSIISNLPGDTGMERILKAFESGGASKSSVDAARAAIDKFDRMVELHVDDRSTLQLVLSSNAPHKVPQEHLHATRKMAKATMTSRVRRIRPPRDQKVGQGARSARPLSA